MSILALISLNSWSVRTLVLVAETYTRPVLQAAGLIPLVHASGGPLLDIVIEQGDLATGFHATTPEDYGRQLGCILSMSPEEALEMRKRARVHAVAHFSEAAFDKEWKEAWRLLVAQSK